MTPSISAQARKYGHQPSILPPAPQTPSTHLALKPHQLTAHLLLFGLGGDIWAYNGKTGQEMWYTNTTSLIGGSGIETPYGTWPLWVFSSQAYTPEVAYLAIGHEYNPPLFHGGQLLAINMTDGSLAWGELGAYIRSVAIANGVLLSLNAYDNQIYAFGKGPTKITVNAPDLGVTTGTPIRITGSITDVSAGVAQSEVAKNFPNGVPCISDASQSKFMEHVYQDQPMPTDVTGVPITLSVLDQNGNYRAIGTTVSTPSGTFGYTWTPDISGDYTLYASFDGSNSYWPTSASTSFYAATPAATATPTQAPIQQWLTNTSFHSCSDNCCYHNWIRRACIVMLRKRP